MELLQRAFRVLLTRRFLWIVIAVGVVYRVASACLISIGFDGNYYVVMGVSFSRSGEFILPWGDPGSTSFDPVFSHHLSPLWPAVMGAALAVFGHSLVVVKGVSLAISLGVLAVAFWATRDLYGTSCALAVTAVLSVFPELILDVGRVYSENLTMLLFILTIWAILKSLRERRFMILGGLFAGLAFLSRSSMGYFFVVAGLAGLAWRFHYMRFEVFKDRSYLAAIGIFGAIVVGWSARNLARFGFPNWETDGGFTALTLAAVARPLVYLQFLVLETILLAVLMLSMAVFFVPELRQSLRAIRNEEESGLWLGVVLVPVLAAFVVAVFAEMETGGPGVFSIDRLRYIVFAMYPLLLIGLRRVEIPMAADSAGSTSVSRDASPIFHRITSRKAVVLLVIVAAMLFSWLVWLPWLIPLFAIGLVALFTAKTSLRLVMLLVVLLLISAEVSTSATWTAEQAAVNYVADAESGAVVAVEGFHHLFYDLSPYALSRGVTLVDVGNLSKADFLISDNVSLRFAGFVMQQVFEDRGSQGIVQSAFFTLLGKPTVISASPIALYRKE